MRRRRLLLALTVALVVPASAVAMLVDIPLEILTGQSELIVVANVLEAGPPAQKELKLPNSPKPVRAWFRTCKLVVTRVITENGKPVSKDAARPADRTIAVIARAQKPHQPGQPRIFVSDAYFPSLREGGAYVLILRKMAGRPEFYLPSYPKNYRPARAEEIARIERAAHVVKWPWGEPVDGLQIALIPRHTTVQLRQIRRSVRGKDGRFRPQFKGRSAAVPCIVALRNVSEKAIRVSLYPMDRFLSVTASGRDGKVVKPDLYARLALMRLRPFGPHSVASIEPGKLLFIHAMGKGDYGFALNLDVSAGMWTLQAAYTGTRKTSQGRALWTGTAKSKPVAIQVGAPAKRF